MQRLPGRQDRLRLDRADCRGRHRPPPDGKGSLETAGAGLKSGRGLSCFARLRRRAFSAPRQLAQAIPPDLETVVLKALAREPAARYATAEDFAEDLRNVIADRPVKARRLSQTSALPPSVLVELDPSEKHTGCLILDFANGFAVEFKQRRSRRLPVIVAINWSVTSTRHFLYVVMSYTLLLLFQMAFFTLVPVATPVEWRTCNLRRGRSERFLAFVQSLDARSNSFPSMHTSVATLTACHLCVWAGPWAFLFPALIALSCLYTKQHYVLDLPAGAAL